MSDTDTRRTVGVEIVSPGPDHLPLVVSLASDSTDVAEWCARNRDWIDAELLKVGAILFRGFAVQSVERFDEFTTTLFDERLSYDYRSTPRTVVGRNIYTATDYPPPVTIPLHNEEAYQRDWPMKLVFCCIRPAASGGQTPLALTRNVTRKIPHDVADRFRDKGVLYVRNYHDHLDLAWSTVFQTEDKAKVGAYCLSHGIEFEWKPDGNLRTRQRAQSMARHPKTGDLLWFNQAHLFHISGLEEQTREAMGNLFANEDLPRNAYFGDGSPIPVEDLEQIRSAFDTETAAFDWEPGNVLLLDNMLISHGRKPYRGERKVLAAMSEPYSSHRETEVVPAL